MARTLNHEFFDKLRHSDYSDYLKSLREFGPGLERSELANLTGLSIHTLRRYESPGQSPKIPQWYELFLRLISGDLSYFGHHWHHCRIHPKTQKLSIPHDQYKAYFPMDMHQKHNLIYRAIKNEKEQIQTENKALKKRIAALESDNELLAVQLERLKSENERLKSHSQSVQIGKVIELFANK